MMNSTLRRLASVHDPIGSRRSVETLFLSDCHLGARHARTADLLAFLQSIRPRQVYLVGDIVDGWALRRRWRWTDLETECLRELLGWGGSGIPIHYAAGNHDNFLEPFLNDFGWARIDREFRHKAANGKQYLVVHGDRFDDEIGTPGWKTWIGSVGYDALFWLGAKVNQLRDRCKLPPTDMVQRWRNSLPAAQEHLARWEAASARHAQANNCDGIICGHVHTPRIRWIGGIEYINIGDWMENKVALVETEAGTLCHWPDRDDGPCVTRMHARQFAPDRKVPSLEAAG
ncbi:UDP-2,3-diacylglucosamine diphosphatase [bacterium]|nr:UDP-2,3-diacylglucosamine diphosphatase [bacterium]